MVEGWIGAGVAGLGAEAVVPGRCCPAGRCGQTHRSDHGRHGRAGLGRRRPGRVVNAAAWTGRRRDRALQHAAATAAGRDLPVTSGYRTYAEQAALYQDYLNGTGNLAAPPGHSTHGLGLSADINVTDPATLRWLHAHAKTYGFVNDVPSEAWHWTWRP